MNIISLFEPRNVGESKVEELELGESKVELGESKELELGESKVELGESEEPELGESKVNLNDKEETRRNTRRDYLLKYYGPLSSNYYFNEQNKKTFFDNKDEEINDNNNNNNHTLKENFKLCLIIYALTYMGLLVVSLSQGEILNSINIIFAIITIAGGFTMFLTRDTGLWRVNNNLKNFEKNNNLKFEILGKQNEELKNENKNLRFELKQQYEKQNEQNKKQNEQNKKQNEQNEKVLAILEKKKGWW